MADSEASKLDKERMRASLKIDLLQTESLELKNFSFSESTTVAYQLDPSYCLWRLSRYKHVSRIISGKKEVLEIGSGDCFASPMVASTVEKLICIEFLNELVEYAQDNVQPLFHNLEIYNHEFPSDYEKIKKLSSSSNGFDAIFSLDVFEHIRPEDADQFTFTASKILSKNGTYIVGIPSLESQAFASEGSKKGHVNCLKKDQLSKHLHRHFNSVIIFGINDETLHTGFAPLCHYLLAICTNPKIN